MTGIDWIALMASAIAAATPLTLAGLGELVAERAGVMNLGVEGMMLVGAVSAFAADHASGSLALGLAAGTLAGMALALVFAVLVLGLQANQVATGLALTLFGSGLSAFAGRSLVGLTVARAPALDLPVLSGLPLIGPLVLHHDAGVYLSVASCALIAWFLGSTRAGLRLRAVGESPAVAHALGQPVMGIRYGAVLFGGAMSGLAGACLSTMLTPMWVEGMTGGRGWIALALVVFATWKPWRVLAGAWLFGIVTVLQLYAQGLGMAVPVEFLSMLPYLATIVVLVLIGRNPRTILLNRPASLGQGFHPGQ